MSTEITCEQALEKIKNNDGIIMLLLCPYFVDEAFSVAFETEQELVVLGRKDERFAVAFVADSDVKTAKRILKIAKRAEKVFRKAIKRNKGVNFQAKDSLEAHVFGFVGLLHDFE